MAAPLDDRPLTWSEVDREALVMLLSSGLTPDQVGALYARTGDLVRRAARGWGLDCRALRARAIGLAVTHRGIASEFVRVVDGAPLSHQPEDLMSGSGARCLWRCSTCGEEWVASVANRTAHKSGCPTCARRRGKEVARARPAKSPPLSRVSEDFADEFVANLSRPERDLASTPGGSHDRILWRCARGHEWETSASQRVKYRTQCPTCLVGLWTSRLEHEVAELVELATGFAVSVGARHPRVDRAAEERVDLLVEEADLLVDLDPTRWHRSPEAMARDARKLDRLADARYVRVRPRDLEPLSTERARAEQQVVLGEGDERDPWVWAAAVVRALRTGAPGDPVEPPAPEARSAALARADRRWRALRSGSRKRSLASEHPTIAAEFVTVVDRPALAPADLAPAGDERAVWRCQYCGHQWEARVANRTQLGTGCPPCSSRRGAIAAAVPRPGRSFADKHPALIPYFLANETNPDKTLSELKPNSIDRCRFTCPYCARPWITTPHALNRDPRRGCRLCGYARGVQNRRRRTGRKVAPP